MWSLAVVISPVLVGISPPIPPRSFRSRTSFNFSSVHHNACTRGSKPHYFMVDIPPFPLFCLPSKIIPPLGVLLQKTLLSAHYDYDSPFHLHLPKTPLSDHLYICFQSHLSCPDKYPHFFWSLATLISLFNLS